MRRLCVALSCLLLCCLSVVSAFAEEVQIPDEAYTLARDADDPIFSEAVTDYPQVGDWVGEEVNTENTQTPIILMQSAPVETPTENVRVYSIVDPAEEDTGSTMVQVIKSVFGEYQRREYSVSEYDGNGNLVGTSTEYVSGLAGVDWVWLAGVFCFSIVLIGFFKMLGVIRK